ncbi:HAMP domain-containing sensor histidine kinase [Paenibacillus qinlingensis]|uniref:histidine kinase n=1 Tax=Paenibacillus qinlingensis TaxID=1837343 RepID=A0ABU1P3N5_9BACL|nr:HAMP domain-containing sensor histidine kinase [Paenibacillus qinlingensis]MDR6554345.1 signal transduction histidine kinase [Paenibacillus qinlingensis]
MSLRLKITLWVSVGLMIILFFSFTFVYYMFIRVTTKGEIDLLKDKASALLLKDLPNHPEYWKNNMQMDELLIPQEMLRYITPDSKVAHQIYSDTSLVSYPASYSTMASEDLITDADGILLFVRTPVFKDGKQVALLEIGRNLRRLGMYSEMLISILVLTSIGALILALIGGYFYTNVLFKPLHQFIATMQNIENSGSFRHITLPDKHRNDELMRLGTTFNRMIDRLQEMFRKQEQFIADASHELRTPLTIIESYASLLRRWASSNDQLREEALEAIVSESAQLKLLTQNLLSLTDTYRENCEQNTDFDLIPLVEQTAASLRITTSREIRVQSELDMKELPMSGDPYQIRQLLIILIDNALKYSQKIVDIRISLQDKWVTLEVMDQGIGIAEEDLPHIFDRFYRSDKARNRKHGGAGLGLAIAQHIVHKHQGNLELQSSLGLGSTAIVTLPQSCQ